MKSQFDSILKNRLTDIEDVVNSIPMLDDNKKKQLKVSWLRQH